MLRSAYLKIVDWLLIKSCVPPIEAEIKQLRTCLKCDILKCWNLASGYLLLHVGGDGLGRIVIEPLNILRRTLAMCKLIVGLIFM